MPSENIFPSLFHILIFSMKSVCIYFIVMRHMWYKIYFNISKWVDSLCCLPSTAHPSTFWWPHTDTAVKQFMVILLLTFASQHALVKSIVSVKHQSKQNCRSFRGSNPSSQGEQREREPLTQPQHGSRERRANLPASPFRHLILLGPLASGTVLSTFRVGSPS